MALSEAAENFVLKYCSGHKYIVHNSLVHHIIDKQLGYKTDDDFHYTRIINEVKKSKIVVGTPQF